MGECFELQMDLPSAIQRDIASYTPGAGVKARRGDRFLGSGRSIVDEMRRCVCGLCVSSEEGAPQSRCTMFSEGGAKFVERQESELCKPVCISKSSVRMLQRLIRSLLQVFASRRTDHDERIVRISLQTEDSSGAPRSRPLYLFDLDFFNGNLEGTFFASLEQLGREEHFRFAYNLGDPIDFENHMSSAYF